MAVDTPLAAEAATSAAPASLLPKASPEVSAEREARPRVPRITAVVAVVAVAQAPLATAVLAVVAATAVTRAQGPLEEMERRSVRARALAVAAAEAEILQRKQLKIMAVA